MDDQERLLLHQRAIESLKQRIEAESYLDIHAVMARLGVKRATVEALPMEILPYVPHGTGSRVYRRYHPADVLAADAKIRRWTEARRRGKGEEYLAQLRQELEAIDEQAVQLAHRTRRSA